MNIIFKNKVKKFGLLLLFCFSLIANAQIEEKEYSSFVPKTLTSFTTGTVQDSEYNFPNQKNTETYCYFSLAIDNDKAPYTGYSVTASFQITPYDQARNLLSAEMVTKSMTVNYNSSFSSVGANFSDLNYFKIKNRFGILVTLVANSIVVKDNVGTVIPIASATANLNNVTVNMGFKAKRYYPLATTLISPTATPNANATALTITWSSLAGALEYELQWTWVDNYSDINKTTVNAPQNIPFTDRNFDLNNTRIVVKANETNNSYEVPQIYGRGYLLYRLRGIGRNATNENTKLYGAWSSGPAAKLTIADWPNQVTIAEHESNKNWQFQASYAESGKKKEVISYFDGSLRNRQTVTKMNTSNTAIIGEVIYDTQGRPAIEVLPTPAADNTIHYYPNYNLFNPTTKYSNKNFDYDSSPCNSITAAMDNTASGSSKYYSANNTFTSSVNRNFIPDAKLFPFSQVEYTPDNTGRISRKGGVGDQHQLGSNHEIKYFYAVPTDLELNRLFGYKVGDVSHYKKNTIIDPNGQISVSYLDPQGRTIATALAGKNLSNLESLSDEALAATILTNNLIKYNTSKSTGLFYNNMDIKSSTKQIVVADLLTYQFNYTLNQTNSFKPECQTPVFSYPFVYDLKINLTNDCGEEQLITPINETAGTSRLDGTAVPVSISKNAFSSKLLTADSYNLIKELKVNESTLNNYVSDYIKKLTTAGSSCYEDPGKYKANASLLLESCNFTCTSCQTALGTKALYVQNAFNLFYTSTVITASGTTTIAVQLNGATNPDNSTIDPIEVTGLISRFSKEWDLLNDECSKLCTPSAVFTSSCTVNDQILLSDVSPNGQYGSTTNTYNNGIDPPVSPNPFYKLSVFNNPSAESATGNQLFYNNTTNGNNWKNPVTPYTNEDGSVAWIDVESANEITFFPSIDNYATIPAAGKQKLTNADGSFSYRINPRYLTNSTDFIANWNDGWAASLVYYHPEYNYLVYNRKLCEIIKNTISTDDYDNRIQNSTTFVDAQSKGFIDAAGTNFDLIYTNDPYFQSFSVAGIETTTLPALRYNASTTGNTSIMYQALKSNYSGNLTLFQNAVKVVLCSPINNCSSAFSIATTKQKDDIWNVYKALYLGLKANIKHIYINLYALEKKTYNGCIGKPTSKNLGDVLGSSFDTQKTAINNAIQAMSATGTLCASTSASLYANLEKRFIPADFGYDSSVSPTAAITNLKAVNGYQIYAQTGNCPLLSDLDLFLNNFFKDTTPFVVTTTNATYTTFNRQYLSSNLLKALSPGVVIPTTTLSINTSSSGTKLDLRFSTTVPSITSGITSLVTPSSTYNWSAYGSTWKIIGLKQFFYDKVTSVPTNGIFNFKVIADISNGVNSTKIGEIILTGTTTAAVGECGTDSNSIGEVLNPNASIYNLNTCDKKTKFETAFVPFLNELKSNGTLNSTTPVNLSNYTTYKNTYLEEFFGSEPLTFWARDPAFSNSYYYIKKADVIVAIFNFESSSLNSLIFSKFNSFKISNTASGEFLLNYDYGDPGLIFTLEGEITLPTQNFVCPSSNLKCIPQPLSPIACDTAKKTDYVEFINGKTGVAPAISNYSIDAATLQFCENNYQYLLDSYKAYINEMKRIGLTSAYDIRFRTISEFGNTYLNYGFSDITNAITKYSAYYITNASSANLLNWNDWVNTLFRAINTFCPPAPIANNYSSATPPDDAEACAHFNLNVDGSYGNDIYKSVIESKRQKFIKDYITQAMAAVETFDMTYSDKEYQYTLYYYDQARNLTQTVAPEGVKRMVLNTALNESINTYRLSNNIVENASYQPAHTFKSQYRYNTLNQLVWQKTPDGGETRFAYDKLGRIIASQNAKQGKQGIGTVKFSYTSYDGLGRIIEAGEVLNPNGSATTTYTINDEGKLVYGGTTIVDAFTTNAVSRTEVTRTIYSDDTAVENWSPSVPAGVTPPVFTRNASYFFSDKSTTPAFNNINRVTAVFYYDTYISSMPLNFNNAVLYNYDIHGNVKEVVNYYPGLRDTNCISSSKNDCEGHVKRIVYDYDLISGNVNTVTFQPNKPDLFIHKYSYDADNRVIDVQTSSDNVIWEKEANYQYYLHGPLARIELGNKKIQGIDYAYTLQGWLKAVNGENLSAAVNDIGQDGLATGSTKTFDAFGFSLNYYDKDYKSIGSTDETSAFKPLMYSRNTAIQPNTKDLYNGNIKQMTTAIRKRDASLLNIQKNSYTYDQLNRIKTMTSSAIIPNATTGSTSYDSNYSYDRNGNLLTSNSKAPNTAGVPTEMDKLSYDYPNETGQTYRNSNKLALVKDASITPSATFPGDLEDQAAKLLTLSPAVTYNIDTPATHNYIYDEIGQLIQDKSEGLVINWRVDGKVKNVIKGTTTYSFEYDGLGNRIAKKETKPGLTTTTYYVRDAQGNELGVYRYDIPGSNIKTLTLTEHHIFGTSRLGLEAKNLVVYISNNTSTVQDPVQTNFISLIGDKRFELSNHLGNVLAVVSDKKIPTTTAGIFNPDVLSFSDYYPFGMLVPNRYVDNPSYRYGFQGQEKDDELKGDGNSLNYTFRMHDPRIGRFFSIDPLTKSYPHYSPYSFSGNKVIASVEFEGLEEVNLFHRTDANGAYGVFESGFNSKFTKNGEFHFFSLSQSSSGHGASVAKAPIQLKVKLDITYAKEITYKQYKGWFQEALIELDYKGPKNLPRDIQARADAIRNEKLWEYMKNNKGNIFKVDNGKAPFIAANDEALHGAEVIVEEGKEILAESIRGKVGKLTKYGTKIPSALPKVFKVIGVATEAYTAYEASMEFANLLNAVFNPNSDAAKQYWKEARGNASSIGHYNTGPTSINPSGQKQIDEN